MNYFNETLQLLKVVSTSHKTSFLLICNRFTVVTEIINWKSLAWGDKGIPPQGDL